MLPATYQVLKDHQVLSTQRQAARIMEELSQRNVTDLANVDDYAMIPDEMRTALCGTDGENDADVVWELNAIMSELSRPLGVVNQLLDGNGHCLCSAQVRRITRTSDGVTVVVTKPGRFITDDPAIAAEYRIRPAVQRLERTVERTAAMIAHDMDRLPGLQKHIPAMVNHAHQVMQRELPPPAAKKNGSRT